MKMKCSLIITAFVLTIAVNFAVGHGAGGDNLCNCNKVMDTIDRVLTHGERKKYIHHTTEHHFAAFSAILTHPLKGKKDGQRVVFNKVITNYGKLYKDGIFTSATDGLYVFHWTILTNPHAIGAAYLAVNGKYVKSGGWAQGGSVAGSASSSVVLQLQKGDKVWIYMRNGHYIHREHSSFQGWLLREI